MRESKLGGWRLFEVDPRKLGATAAQNPDWVSDGFDPAGGDFEFPGRCTSWEDAKETAADLAESQNGFGLYDPADGAVLQSTIQVRWQDTDGSYPDPPITITA